MNIGAVARAMANFGLSDLRLVSPRDGWPNPDAGPAAAGADWVLDGARVFDSIEAAVADLSLVLATAMTTRDMTRRVLTPRGAASELRSLPVQCGLVFGPERTGLTAADLLLCHAIVSIPTAPDFGSLNLAQAVVVLAWEWFAAADATPPERLVNYHGPAPRAELDSLIVALEEVLDNHGYFNPAPGLTEAAQRMLRNLLTRPGFTAPEVRSLRGVLRSLVHPRRRSLAARLYSEAPRTHDRPGTAPDA